MLCPNVALTFPVNRGSKVRSLKAKLRRVKSPMSLILPGRVGAVRRFCPITFPVKVPTPCSFSSSGRRSLCIGTREMSWVRGKSSRVEVASTDRLTLASGTVRGLETTILPLAFKLCPLASTVILLALIGKMAFSSKRLDNVPEREI